MFDLNIQMIQETLAIMKAGGYTVNGKEVALRLSKPQMRECRVYLPKKIALIEDTEGSFEHCDFDALNMGAFELARKRVREDAGKGDHSPVLVLNLANSVNPGGGVRNGARAQEEDLCRKSTLLASLESPEAAAYYQYNMALYTAMGSDGIILTPRVEIIRDGDGALLESTDIVSVMTCAAPNLCYGMAGMSNAEYRTMMHDRIVAMLRIAAANGYRKLILGAFGCGAFKNDAHVVSDIFYDVFNERNGAGTKWRECFRRVDFAVLNTREPMYNFHEFERNFAKQNFYREEKTMDHVSDKIRGCLIGGAAGDALGYAIEFINEDLIFRSFGRDGIRKYSLDGRIGKAAISDDTQMTLFTANGLLAGITRAVVAGKDSAPLAASIREAYLDWLTTQYAQEYVSTTGEYSWLNRVPGMNSDRAPGGTCLHSLRDGGYGTVNDPINDRKGCGGVMRVAPVALVLPEMDIGERDMLGAAAAAITHGHTLGYASAAVLVHIISRIVFAEKKMTLREIVEEARDTVCAMFSNKNSIFLLRRIIDLAIDLSENTDDDLTNIHRLGQGWVAEETLAIAIYCALKYENDFSKAIITAVNHNGDSDSTGAVCGNIVGAIHGYAGIDNKWKQDLEMHDVILEIADDLNTALNLTNSVIENDPDWKAKYLDCKWPGGKKACDTEIRMILGDITKVDNVEAIVNAANTSLLGGGGVDGAIHRAAGPRLFDECRRLNGCATGDAKITGAYNLPCKYVIHTPGPVWHGGYYGEDDALASSYRRCMEVAMENGVRSIAFPSISTGVYSFPLNRAAKIAVDTVKKFIKDHPGKFDLVEWVLFNSPTLREYEKANAEK